MYVPAQVVAIYGVSHGNRMCLDTQITWDEMLQKIITLAILGIKGQSPPRICSSGNTTFLLWNSNYP